ncbi:MAG: LysR family transcriptional regulator [Burkholderiaceae bacterium]
MDTIEAMRTFVAVARELSFTAGAKQLGISTKVASKQIQMLEARLCAQLFNRTTRSVALTETGSAYFKQALPVLEQFDELEGLVQLRQSDLAGQIRISAPTAFGSSELVQAIVPFQKAHPRVTIDLALSDQRVAVVEEGFDLAIRIGELEDSNLIARRLMMMRVVVVASPDYLKRYGEPQQPAALQSHNCLVLQTSVDSHDWRFRVDGQSASFRVGGPVKANAPRAIAQMAVGGLGIGQVPFYVVEDLIREKRLKVILEAMETEGIAVCAIYPRSRHLTARIRALIDHLVSYFQR